MGLLDTPSLKEGKRQPKSRSNEVKIKLEKYRKSDNRVVFNALTKKDDITTDQNKRDNHIYERYQMFVLQ